jgi:WD40 repeat protein
MAFAADGRRLATGDMDKAAKLWEVETGREKTGGLLGHGDAISCVAFHPDGKTIATGGVDHAIRLWDAVTGQELVGHLPRPWP